MPEQRKLPLKTKTIELANDYAGWSFVARSNPPMRVYADMQSGLFDRIASGLTQVVISWNFVNEEGNEMEPPSLETILDLPLDLITAMISAFTSEVNKLPPN